MSEFAEPIKLRATPDAPIVIALDPNGPSIEVRDESGLPLVLITPKLVELRGPAGARLELDESRATLELRDADGHEKVHLNGEIGLLELRHHADLTTIRLDGRLGMIQVLDDQGAARARIRAHDSGLVLADQQGMARLRASGDDGSLELGYGETTVRADGTYGTVELSNRHGVGVPRSVKLDGRYGTVELWNTLDASPKKTVACDGRYGTVTLRDGTADRVHLDGRFGTLTLKSADGGHWLTLDGRYGSLRLSGDVELANADCAEDFETSDPTLRPGEVVVIGEDSRLRPCESAYNPRVAGVISGAGGLRPGIVLDHPHPRPGHLPVALAGKVFVYADARPAPIRPGDPLTTAVSRGHAQHATDPRRSAGAIIGKALAALERETGLIPMLVGPR
jgi:hypothetical protein